MRKGNMKFLAVVALIALLAGSWYSLFNNAGAKQQEYDGYLSLAREQQKKELYDESFDNFDKALAMRDSIELREEIATAYQLIDRADEYIAFCEDTINAFPHDEQAYVRLAEQYNKTENRSMCFQIMTRAKKRGIQSDALSKLYASLQYEFEYRLLGFEEVSIFSNDLCAVKRPNGKWSYTDLRGSAQLGFLYTDASDYTGEYMAVQLESGEYALIDSTGREKSKDAEKKAIEDCLFLFEDKMAVKYNGKYHYCDKEFKELFGAFDYAGTFSSGYAAVMDGGKWFIIDSTGAPVGNKTFEEIKVDEKGVAFRNGVAFAKQNGTYCLIDTAGNKVGEGSWTDVDCFNSDEPAAVSNGTLWGFVDATGKLVVDYTYGKARSFSNGFAAVCSQEKWGYIISDGNALKIEYQFADAMDFSRSGTAYVKGTHGWDLIKLYSYNQ